MILKTIRTLKKADFVYTEIPYLIEEELKYYDFGKEDVVVQTVSNSSDYQKEDSFYPERKVLYAVISGDITVYVHEDEYAYLLNDSGKTLQIIYRP